MSKEQLNEQVRTIKAAIFDALVQKQNAESSIEQLQNLLKQKYADLEAMGKEASEPAAEATEAVDN
jgi:hypothetical protein